MPNENKNIIDPILQPTAKELNENLKQDSEILQKAARQFLSEIRLVINKYAHIRVLLKSRKGGIGESLKTIYQMMKQSTQITQSCIKSQYKFETALNTFLKRKILLLYITQDNKFLYGDEITAAKIYRTATAGKKGKGNIKQIGKSDQKKLNQFPKEISQNFKNIIQDRQFKYAPIQDEAVKRWTQNHSEDNPWVKANKNHKDTFYWLVRQQKNKKVWNWSKQINRGHIKEAYAYLVWEAKQVENFSPQVEADIGRFWNYMESHDILNSEAGIVKGDVSFFENPSIQLAVKSGSFNTAAIGRYIDVAYQLAYGNITINKEMVENLLKNIQSYGCAVRNYGLEKAEEKLKQIIQSTGAQVM